MKNITDIIEQYLKAILEEDDGAIEIKRNEVAEKFQCVPSQINYVINTRFTIERGYAVESKRGGGGYIRIYQIQLHSKKDVLDHALEMLGRSASHGVVEDVMYMLLKEEVVTEREARMLLAGVSRAILDSSLPNADEWRAKIVHSMIETLYYR